MAQEYSPLSAKEDAASIGHTLVVLKTLLKAVTSNFHKETLKATKPTDAYVFYHSNNNNSAKLRETEYLLMSSLYC